MQTLYIDVYFLINFSIDLLAMFLSVRVLHAASGVRRITLSACVGALYAVVFLFLPKGGVFLRILGGAVCLILMGWIGARGASLLRRCRLMLVFLLFEMLLGGSVYYGYQILDKYVLNGIIEEKYGAENRALLVFAVIVCLSFGVLRLFGLLIGEARSERVCQLTVAWQGDTVVSEALVDTGNVLKDPLNGLPVILIKPSVVRQFSLGKELLSSDLSASSVKTRLHLIPCHTGSGVRVLYGVRPDGVWIGENHRREEISAVIALDKEDGSFGGYGALVPSAVFEHAFF